MFKNYDDYKAQRDALLAQAQGFADEGKQEDYDKAVQAVNDLDAKYTEWAQRQSDLAALQGAAHHCHQSCCSPPPQG